MTHISPPATTTTSTTRPRSPAPSRPTSTCRARTGTFQLLPRHDEGAARAAAGRCVSAAAALTARRRARSSRNTRHRWCRTARRRRSRPTRWPSARWCRPSTTKACATLRGTRPLRDHRPRHRLERARCSRWPARLGAPITVLPHSPMPPRDPAFAERARDRARRLRHADTRTVWARRSAPSARSWARWRTWRPRERATTVCLFVTLAASQGLSYIDFAGLASLPLRAGEVNALRTARS